MSEGPIRKWRDGFKVPRASTPQSTAVHAVSAHPGKAYCGRTVSKFAATDNWHNVTCADCAAAHNADLES